MATRRCIRPLISLCCSTKLSNPSLNLHSSSLASRFVLTEFRSTQTRIPGKSSIFSNFQVPILLYSRNFCSKNKTTNTDNDDDDSDESEAEDSEDDESENVQGKSDEEKAQEAAEIGYKVIGSLQESDRVFKPYEPVFAVVQIGSHQFKVSNGDSIFTEKLKYCDVNDKLILNRVLMLGSKSQTMIGRPVLPDASVHAVVEEHALDAKVIIFKKKRRKNYRRTRGHRQELTKLRITDIEGIEKPEMVPPLKTEKKTVKKTEKKVAVAA